jgi:dTDP-4-dehydrorhamnose 3,5-epimerase
MIHGVKIKRLTVHPDERGRLMEILRADDEGFFIKFGQIYLTTTLPGVVKAWHSHATQSDNVTCVRGMIKLALYDTREDSPTRGEIQELHLGEHAPLLVQIPSRVFHGWKCISVEEAFIINCPTEAYNYSEPDETRRPPDSPDIPYDWYRRPDR